MRSHGLRRFLLAAGAAAVLVSAAPTGAFLAPPALAGDAMPGKHYENRIVGFRFRPLNEWAAVPPGTDPSNPRICGFYSDAAKYDRSVKPECSVYGFPRQSQAVATPSGDEGGGPAQTDEEKAIAEMLQSMKQKSIREVMDSKVKMFEDIAEQVTQSWDEKKKKKVLGKMKVKDLTEKELKTEDGVIKLTELSMPVPLTNGELLELHMVAGSIENDEYEIGVLYEIPGSEWKKYSSGVYASIKSLEFLTGEAVAAARKDLEDALAGKTGDQRWLEEIKRKVGPGWAHLQTKNYLIVYDKIVKPDRVRLIAIQIEAIRKDVYEVLFPPDRPVTAISVVRVCKDREQYAAYGGPSGSAGYWNWAEQELVFFEDTQAKKDALRVLNHEAFHQFIFYSVGSISPHDWFNEGHGDYFSGHNYNQGGKFIPKPFSWRQGEIKNAMGAKKYIPLKTFMKYTHEQYYGPLIGQNYAQGWSVIWFLRQNRNPEWKDILPTYFNTLKGEVTKWVSDEIDRAKKDGKYTEGWKPSRTPPDVEEKARETALNAAFNGWDDKKWSRFEKEWLDFKY
jgi:hypothetical protein